MTAKPLSFLIVEDDDVDFEAIQRAFRKLKIENPVVRAHDGIEALQSLRGEGGANSIDSPVLVFLDLNMPRMNGHEFLAALAEDEALKGTQVVIMSTSRRDDDMRNVKKYGVRGYMVKDDLVEYLKEFLEDFNSHAMLVAA